MWVYWRIYGTVYHYHTIIFLLSVQLIYQRVEAIYAILARQCPYPQPYTYPGGQPVPVPVPVPGPAIPYPVNRPVGVPVGMFVDWGEGVV